jgi:hypothetical protein
VSSGIIDTIKKAVIEAWEATMPVVVLHGTVTSTSPVQVKIGENLTLDSSFLVVNGTVENGEDVIVIRIQGGQKYVVVGLTTVINRITINGGDGSVIGTAVSWACAVADDDSYTYSMTNRWGPKSYDCSSFVITAYANAGVPVKQNGASVCDNMPSAFLKSGFVDVTKSVNIATGAGMKMGDVVVKLGADSAGHAGMIREDGGAMVIASNSALGIRKRNYYNGGWDYVLRYAGSHSVPTKKDDKKDDKKEE